MAARMALLLRLLGETGWDRSPVVQAQTPEGGGGRHGSDDRGHQACGRRWTGLSKPVPPMGLGFAAWAHLVRMDPMNPTTVALVAPTNGSGAACWSPPTGTKSWCQTAMHRLRSDRALDPQRTRLCAQGAPDHGSGWA